MVKRSSIVRIATLTALTALMAVAIGLLRPPSSHAAYTDTDGDGTVDLTEEIFGSDAADAQSTPEDSSFPFFFISLVACIDGIDNDGDGLTDGDDAGCMDRDEDGASDALEQLLGSDADDEESYPEDARFDGALATVLGFLFSTCADFDDNDGDGLEDAADPGCAPLDADGDGFRDAVEKGLGSDGEDANSRPEHDRINPFACVDGVDNDGDTLVDLADPGCQVAPNDNFADAIVVSALPFTHTAKVLAATAEQGEVESGCVYTEGLRQTLWYRFTSPADTRVLIDTAGSDIILAVSVWRDTPSGLIEIECNEPFSFFPGTGTDRFAFAAAAGQTYYIQIERPSSADLGGVLDLGRLSVHLEATVSPANDDFAAAGVIDSLPFSASADTVAAVMEPTEPDASCRFQGQPSNSVWYRYTPGVDTYVRADVDDGTDFGVTLGVFEGASLATLEQVACGEPLAFHALAGHTYYLQAAGYQCGGPGGGEGGIASFCISSRSGHVNFTMETFQMPSCPAPTFTFSDPRGDQELDTAAPDIVGVGVVFAANLVCLTVSHDSDDSWSSVVEFDLDQDISTGGRGHVEDVCHRPIGLGTEFLIVPRPYEGLLLFDLETGGGAYVVADDSSYTLIIPLAALGGDDRLSFAVDILGHGISSDCAPNGGHIRCASGACAFVPFRNGDINCNLRTDSVDAVITLQYSAGLFSTLACPDAADINGDGRIDSLDASLILQFEAGLLGRLPPPCDPRLC